MEHLHRDPHYSMEPFYQRYNYLDDTYHTAPAYYTEKAPLHKVIDPSYFKAYEGWHINIRNAITYQALKNMMMIFHGFQDLYISSSTSTTATFVCLLPTENQMLTPVSKFLGQEVRDKTKHELNIQRIIRRIPTHIKGHYVEKPLRDDHPHPGAALCLPHIAQIVFSKYESANTALIASQWYETTVRIATMARKGFQIGDKLFLEDLPAPTTKPLHDGRVIFIQKANPRPSHLERQLQDDMEWNAILAITRQHTVEEYQQYLPPEILGVHKLILYVNTKLQEWQTRNNESCLQNNIFSRADIHMMIHVLKFFSPRHAEWRFTREIFGPDYTILDFNGSTCAIPMQPLRDNSLISTARRARPPAAQPPALQPHVLRRRRHHFRRRRALAKTPRMESGSTVPDDHLQQLHRAGPVRGLISSTTQDPIPPTPGWKTRRPMRTRFVCSAL